MLETSLQEAQEKITGLLEVKERLETVLVSFVTTLRLHVVNLPVIGGAGSKKCTSYMSQLLVSSAFDPITPFSNSFAFFVLPGFPFDLMKFYLRLLHNVYKKFNRHCRLCHQYNT